MPNRILSMHRTRKIPTPTDTVKISTKESIWDTFPDRTCRSGSAIVIMTPIRKLTARMIAIFRDFVSVLPSCWPITTIELSEPYIKMLRPIISRTLPTRKESIASVATGAARKARIQTIIPIGRTELIDSWSFVIRTLFFSMTVSSGL
jgi:hypothetical protein